MDIVEKRFVEKPRIWKKFGSTFTKEKRETIQRGMREKMLKGRGEKS